MASRVFWIGDVPKCDMGNAHTLANADGVYEFADARIPGYSQWGILCPACIARFRPKFGMGMGQLYTRQESGEYKGRFMKTKG